MQWWGYSKEHGWVVLDRRVESNVAGIKKDLLFVRCSDAATFVEKRERWNPPAYKFAANYIRELPPGDAEAAEAELQGLKERWSEFESVIQRECKEAEEKLQAVRIEEEKAKKQAAAEKRKQAAAAKAQAAADKAQAAENKA